MAFLNEKDLEYVHKHFQKLEKPVKLVLFTQEHECQYCRETRQILDEIEKTSDKLTVEIYDFLADKHVAEKYNIDKIPAIVIEGEKDYGIRYYGIPSGYEFSSLLDDILDVSKAESGLSEVAKELLKEIKKPLHLQVFVTPTCPYCPAAVKLAHKLALENEYIKSDMIEATEFPHLSNKFNVRGVPRTIIADITPVEGAVAELDMINKVIETYKSIYN